MIDEIKLLQEIIGDLSGLGAWLVAAYLGYKLAVGAAVVYVFRLLIVTVSAHFKVDMTKREAEHLRAEIVRVNSAAAAEKVRSASEIERVKHLYKILKEAKDAE